MVLALLHCLAVRLCLRRRAQPEPLHFILLQPLNCAEIKLSLRIHNRCHLHRQSNPAQVKSVNRKHSDRLATGHKALYWNAKRTCSTLCQQAVLTRCSDGRSLRRYTILPVNWKRYQNKVGRGATTLESFCQDFLTAPLVCVVDASLPCSRDSINSQTLLQHVHATQNLHGSNHFCTTAASPHHRRKIRGCIISHTLHPKCDTVPPDSKTANKL